MTSILMCYALYYVLCVVYIKEIYTLLNKQVTEGKIDYKNIHFRYPTRREVKVLRGLSLSIPKGKRVAFVGPSGCGKTTLIQLLQRLYDPETGTVVSIQSHICYFTMQKSIQCHWIPALEWQWANMTIPKANDIYNVAKINHNTLLPLIFSVSTSVTEWLPLLICHAEVSDSITGPGEILVWSTYILSWVCVICGCPWVCTYHPRYLVS